MSDAGDRRGLKAGLASALLGAALFLLNLAQLSLFPGQLVVSLALLLAPAAWLGLSRGGRGEARLADAALLLVPAACFLYAYWLSMRAPVGFEDPHHHLLQASLIFSEDGHLLFTQADRVSLSFVSLYTLMRAAAEASGLDLVLLTSLLPPFVGLVTLLVLLPLASGFRGAGVALLALLLFLTENQVILFTQELRTQTLGALFLFLLMLNLSLSVHRKAPASSFVVVSAVLLGALAFTSFTVNAFALIILGASLAWWRWGAHPDPEGPKAFPSALLAFYVVAAAAYILFVSGGFAGLVIASLRLGSQIISALFGGSAAGSVAASTGQGLYGELVRWLSYSFWLVVLVAGPVWAFAVLRGRDRAEGAFLAAFSVFFLFMLVNAAAGPLSVGRLYVMVLPMLTIAAAYGLVRLRERLRGPAPRGLVTTGAFALVLLIAMAGVVKVPSYVVGDARPLRGESPIDGVPYWHHGAMDARAAEFVCGHGATSKISLFVPIHLHRFQACPGLGPATQGPTLVVTRDRFLGEAYTYREDVLEKVEPLRDLDVVYASGDYLVLRIAAPA